jgi:hypothetical protein
MPFSFTQDELLDTDGFIRAAKDRGYQLTLDDLQTLHNNRLLLPLYRVSDTSVIGRCIDVVPDGNLNYRRRAQEAAAAGRLRDSADEGYSVDWPYRHPAALQAAGWWNGFLYSSWQLLDLHLVVRDLAWLRSGSLDTALRQGVVERRRKRVLALAALAPRYLPGILGKLSIPPSMEQGDLERYRFESDVLGLLKAVGLDPAQLKDEAENLLGNAHAWDPLVKWLPLIRHANYSAWSKLRGEPLHFQWLRIGAEVLLRGHEDLAAIGKLEPLPDMSGATWWYPLYNRLGRTDSLADPLEQVLGSFGLSPYPRVLLLIEGETELIHAPRLLSEFGLDRPEQVRVQPARSARTNPQLLARYAVTPRLGQKLGEGWRLTATPTALVIAMDPENRWATPEKRKAETRRIRDAIREEVELQGGQISDSELDVLVNLHIYDQYYELANFSDDELLPVLATLASGPHAKDVGSDAWREDTRRKLENARQTQANFDTVIGRLRITKKGLAEALWPVLLSKIERELAADTIETPALKVMLEVQRLVALLSSGSYMLRSGGDDASERPDSQSDEPPTGN